MCPTFINIVIEIAEDRCKTMVLVEYLYIKVFESFFEPA